MNPEPEIEMSEAGMSTPAHSDEFDAIVIGTGFAGAVTACRLVEAGLKICVLERGRRYGPNDFPSYPSEDLLSSTQNGDSFAPPPDFSRWLWGRDHGIYDIRDLDGALSVQAAGYGGGSLIYANVHLRPPREVFEHRWPSEYYANPDGSWTLEPYFDLAAYMLRVSPIPKTLAKSLQLKNAGHPLAEGSNNRWFRTPVAINFDEDTTINPYGRTQHACDMRGKCCVGCDRGAKNSLDVNYLSRAECGTPKPDVRTLAEVTRIDRDGASGIFTVSYSDLLFRHPDGQERLSNHEPSVRARHVFLCAGTIGTTELLLRNPQLINEMPSTAPVGPLGSHYFPNADSLATVFDCRDSHEADYGPTITSALLYRRPVKDEFGWSLDFSDGNGPETGPSAGAKVRGTRSGATAVLSYSPQLDWGHWKSGGAAGMLVFNAVSGRFEPTETLDIDGGATATARSTAVRQTHWFLAEDGGYPPDLEPLVGVFRSPLWLRRNRYVEFVSSTTTKSPQRSAQQLRVQSLTDSIAGTARRAGSAGGLLDRVFDPTRFRATDLLEQQIGTFFPKWFVDGLKDDHKELLEQASAMALPLFGRLLGELSKTVAERLDTGTVSRLVGNNVSEEKKQVLIRGMLRQTLQVLAGSEAAVASKAATLLLDPIPATPEKLLDSLGQLLLWTLAYNSLEGHCAIVLTMGRDLYRGRLELVGNGEPRERRLTARLPNRLLDSSRVVQEQVLRVIAKHWGGELRTNPASAILGRHLTVHNQGGCPMGPDSTSSVTGPDGQVHGCQGLYVMDAAAFPTSVGVNPSATIAAVAEFKIERFIREHTSDKSWTARDKDDARTWVNPRRAELDPLNQLTFLDNEEPRCHVLGLTFKEQMDGFVKEVPPDAAHVDFNDLNGFRHQLYAFTDAEDEAIRGGTRVTADLTATVTDLARLISPQHEADPVKINLTGTLTLRDLRTNVKSVYSLNTDSYLQLFVKPPKDETPPVRFFRYCVTFQEDGQTSLMKGLKVLRDSPGFDAWSDTSTLYVEIVRGTSRRRGVVRISVDGLQQQLQSISVTGTDAQGNASAKGDPARKSWALVAFYKFFLGELTHVYAQRVEAMKQLLVNAVTTIHV
jgi:choline dehydrogenase-like flavoprotein